MAHPLRNLVAAALLLGAGAAQAFKIDTHLWLADHLLAEIGQGQVRFDGGPAVPLQERVWQSISRYPDAFRIGVLGADLYPDLVAGQMTTHPGLPPRFSADPDSVPTEVASLSAILGRPITGTARGWQTDDWLAHVLDAASGVRPGPTPELAFAYGYLLHAAMDTWAHSYVNVYTGDLFSIVENQEIAARHTVLETFIRDRHPDYVVPVAPQPAGRRGPAAPVEQLRQRAPADNLAAHAAPTRFVRNTLILNAAAANQYARTPGGQHVYAMWLVWDTAVRTEQGWQQARQGLDQLLNQASAAVLEADAAWRAADQAKSGAETAAALALTAKQNAESALVEAGSDFAAMVGDVLDFLQSTGVAQATEATIENFLGYLPPPMRTAYVQARTAASNADKALQDAVDAYEQAARHTQDMAEDLLAAAEALDLQRAAEQAARDARNLAWQAVDQGIDGWRANIETAVDAYVRAFEETAREIMRGSGGRFRKGANVTWPLKEWAACWGPLFGMPAMPVPPGMAAEACQQGLSAYSHARQNLTLLKNNAPFDLLGLQGLKQQIESFEAQLHERVRDGIPLAGHMIGQALGPLSDGAPVQLVPGTASFMAAMWDKHPTPEDLNAEFLHDDSNANLPVYPASGPRSVSEMLRADGLPPVQVDSVADMLDFVPVRNALQMSRLALLDGVGLNALAGGFGVTGTAYPDGQPAYPDGAPPGSALIGAIRSIDGNHQWQPVAPPLPRRVFGGAGHNIADAECRRFGYPADGNYGPESCPKDAAAEASPAHAGWLSGKHGFRLWLDPALRGQVFYGLFRGPLSTAVCAKLEHENAAGHYAGLGCFEGESYPPSDQSAYSVASLAPAQPGPAAGMQRAPAPRVQAGPVRRNPPATSRPVDKAPARSERTPVGRAAPAMTPAARQPATPAPTSPATSSPAPRSPAPDAGTPDPRRAPPPVRKPAPEDPVSGKEEAAAPRDPRRR